MPGAEIIPLATVLDASVAVRWIATALLLAFAAGAAAQSSTATVSGTIRDETGVLPGATVSAKDAQSGFTTETVSGGDSVDDPYPDAS